MDFDDTYEIRLAAALSSGQPAVVPHNLNDWYGKETKNMEMTIQGVKMNGTREQLAEIARKLGAEVGNDGVWYNSTSRGLLLISEMEENHVRNAIAKRYREHFENLKNLSSVEFTNALQGPRDKTTVALVARLVQLNYKKTFRVPRNSYR